MILFDMYIIIFTGHFSLDLIPGKKLNISHHTINPYINYILKKNNYMFIINYSRMYILKIN